MLKLRINKRGSVTVLVTLILVPVIFFNGFLVDLARFKLFQNQAVMTADNYASAVLSEYEGVLQELYGLFAITQDKAALKNIDTVKKYLGYTFDPSEGNGSDGMLPYRNAKVDISYAEISNSALNNPAILTTQISDYMKYRIVQVLFEQSEDTNSVLNALDTISNAENNIDVAESYDKLAKASEKTLEKAKDYYECFPDFLNYEGQVATANAWIDEYNTFLENIEDNVFYNTYRKKETVEDEDGETEEKWAKLPVTGEVVAELEKIHLHSFTSYDELEHDELAIAVQQEFTYYMDELRKREPSFDRYAGYLSALRKKSDKYISAIKTLEEKKKDIQDKLAAGNVDDNMASTIEDRIRELDNISSSEEIEQLTSAMEGNQVIVDEQKGDFDEALNTIETDQSEASDDEGYLDVDLAGRLPVNDYYKCETNNLYIRLGQMFNDPSKSEKERKAENAKNRANNQNRETNKQIEDDNDVPAYTIRDLPHVGGYSLDASSYSADQPNSAKMFDTIRALFDLDSVIQGGIDLMDKFYLVSYDDGMFTSRVTNVKEGEEHEETLSGVPFSDKVDYVYGAELEYLVAGKYESKSNLNTVRNRIITFRMLLNYMSTYSIPDLNNAVNYISEAVAAINPLLGIAANQAIRVAIAGACSVKDWEELKQGKSVKLYKDKLSDMAGLREIAGSLGLNISVPEKTEEDGFALDYAQYVQIMLLFFVDKDTLAMRTGNLIMVNVNHIRQGSPQVLSSFDSFKINEAYTAVDVKVQGTLDFCVMPKNFAKSVLDGGTYSELIQMEKNNYIVQMKRGY